MKRFAVVAGVLFLTFFPLVIFVTMLASLFALTGQAASAVTCMYAVPKPGLAAQTMLELTDEPVQVQQWDRYAAAVGYNHAYDDSTPEQRSKVLDWGLTTIMATGERSVVNLPFVWWQGAALSEGDDNETWRNEPVPGWDGTMETYLDAFIARYGQIQAESGEEVECIPAGTSACPQPFNIDAVLATIRWLESSNDYNERRRAKASGGAPGSGWPSGAYQFIYDTWGQYGGFNEAWEAPPDVQDARATQDVELFITKFGDVSAVPLAWYIGESGTARVLANPDLLHVVPNPKHNTLTPAEYRDRWMDKYIEMLPVHGSAPEPCPAAGDLVIKWAETQIGAPYAMIAPYRLGSPPWPGGQICQNGFCYTHPAGTIVYDCSGFVITAWRQAGVDLPSLGAWYSGAMATSPQLITISIAELQPGDIATYSPNAKGIGHVVLIHSITDTGIIKTIESTPSGVHIGTLNLPRVTRFARIPLPDN